MNKLPQDIKNIILQYVLNFGEYTLIELNSLKHDYKQVLVNYLKDITKENVNFDDVILYNTIEKIGKDKIEICVRNDCFSLFKFYQKRLIHIYDFRNIHNLEFISDEMKLFVDVQIKILNAVDDINIKVVNLLLIPSNFESIKSIEFILLENAIRSISYISHKHLVFEILQKLIDYGLNLYCVNFNGLNLFQKMYGPCSRMPSECLDYFVEKKFDINIQDKDGNTILMNTVYEDNYHVSSIPKKMNLALETIKIFTQRGADARIKNKLGQTVYDLIK